MHSILVQWYEINKNETKRNEINKNETKRNQRNENEIKTKPTEAKRNQRNQNEIENGRRILCIYSAGV
jgi:hypothetical protein